MGKSYVSRTVIFLSPKPFIKHTRTTRSMAVIRFLNPEEASRIIGFRRRSSLVLPVLGISAFEQVGLRR